MNILKSLYNFEKNQYWLFRAKIRDFYFQHHPIQNNKIIFDNFWGRGYGCNLKYIAKEIIAQKLPIDMVWVVGVGEEGIPPEIRTVQKGSREEKYEVSTARIWIKNTRCLFPYHKRKGQYYIQTWHGGCSLKKVEKARKEDIVYSKEDLRKYVNRRRRDLSKFIERTGYFEHARLDASMTDLILSNSLMMTKEIQNFFWHDGDILECGYPRNDVLVNYKDNKEYRKELCIKLGLNASKKYILYAPTFRDDISKEVFQLDTQGLIRSAEEKFGGEWSLLIRLHPNMASREDIFRYSEKIINVCNVSDMQELMLVSDILITDYSSTMFEFLLLDRPVLLYVKDADDMVSTGRIKKEFYALPFPKAENDKALQYNILNFDEEEYKEKVKGFKMENAGFDNGDAAKQVVEVIKKIMKIS